MLFNKYNDDDRIEALSGILALGLPSSISPLIPYLRDYNPEIRHLTCRVVVELFSRISTKNDFYETVKYANISTSDLDLYKKNFRSHDYWVLLAIASLNCNGYVREKAVRELAKSQSNYAIQFIVFRLADWVHNVREVAINSLENFKKREYINGLVENIPTIEWLQSVERLDLDFVYMDIMDFIIVQNRKMVLGNFKGYSDKIRILLSKKLVQSDQLELKDLQLLLSDRHFIVRKFALSHFGKLTENEVSRLLKDKSSRVRYETLSRLRDTQGFSKLVFGFIADDSARIREIARGTLKGEIADFAAIYDSNLHNGKKIAGSLSGLAELDAKEFTAAIKPFLTHESVRVRRCAFLALKKLDEATAFDYALTNLGIQYRKLRMALIDLLGKNGTDDVLEKARSLYKEGDSDLKISMLKLFSKIGRWAAIGDLMLGTLDEQEGIRNQSVQYVKRWKAMAVSYFTQPKPGELERANQIFAFAFEFHEEKRYYPDNPLTGLNFYFQ